jgi:hypothetical protein
MTDGYGIDPGSIPTAVTKWEDVGELMTTTKTELAGQSPIGFAPSVQGAASAFLTAWSGFAGESRAIADGFVSALQSTQSSYGRSDQLSAGELDRLDGRLGPAR